MTRRGCISSQVYVYIYMFLWAYVCTYMYVYAYIYIYYHNGLCTCFFSCFWWWWWWWFVLYLRTWNLIGFVSRLHACAIAQLVRIRIRHHMDTYPPKVWRHGWVTTSNVISNLKGFNLEMVCWWFDYIQIKKKQWTRYNTKIKNDKMTHYYGSHW